MALSLPGPVRERLSEWAALPASRWGLRAVPVESLHVTLCFLGAVAVSEVEPITAALAVVRDAGEASLAPAGALWLPRRRPSVLAVRLGDEDGRLAAVQARLSAALQHGGWYLPERRVFLPHVTVARVRRGTVGLPRDPPSEPSLPTFAGSQVTLFRSHVSAAGARYEPLGSVSLGGGG